MRERLGAVFKTPHSIRLERDLAEMTAFKKDSTIFDFKVSGDPPNHYLVTFKGDTLVPTDGKKFGSEAADVGNSAIGGPQQVEIKMGVDYPRSRPEITWKTPIQHPNIWGSGTVCLGNYANAWTPHFRLVDLMEILWDMARLAVLNPRSAGTGAYKAEETWSLLDKKFKFPVDRRPLRNKVLGNNEGSSIVRPEGEETEIMIFPDEDEGCPR
jgi:hypothetical protein